MSTPATQSLTPAQRCVNAALGIADTEVATMIKRHPYGVKIMPIPPTNPGWLNDKPGAPISTIIEPEVTRPSRILFPDGSTSSTRKKGKSE